MTDTPRYKHDCDQCVFLGRKWFLDLYFHPSEEPALQTVVARLSDEPEDYESGIGTTMGTYVACEAAVARGLLPAEVLTRYS